jgi:ribokinase
MENRVIVIGSLNYDNFIHVRELPKKGETKQITVIDSGCGGKGANQACQCADLGLKTFMVGAVGNDSYGTLLLESLKKSGAEVSLVRKTVTSSGQGYVICAADGSLFSTILKGANDEVCTADVDAALKDCDEQTFVVLQMEIPVGVVEYAITAAHEKGAKIIVNAAPAVPIDKKYFSLCDLLVLNETEAMFYLQKKFKGKNEVLKIIPKFAEELSTAICITLGPEGVVYCGKEGLYEFPAVDVPVVETTGAGDSFIGGLIYSMSRNMSIPDCLKTASYCSAITIQQVGAQNAMPDLKQLTAVLQNK